MFFTKYNKEAKEWSGRDVHRLYNKKISLAHVMLKACAFHGPKIAQISDNTGIQLTFDDIRIKSIRAAQNLQKRGYKPKQVFGLMAKNSHHLAPIVFASISIGCSVNTLDPTFGKTDLIHMLQITKPELMFCDIEAYDLVKQCLTELGNDSKVFTFGGDKDEAEPVENLFSELCNDDDFNPVEVDIENDIAFIVCTSGTSGLSKGVCLSHDAVITSISNFNTINSCDVMLCFSSLYWLSGVMFIFSGTLCGATRIITTEAFSVELQLRLIKQYKVSIILNPPHQLILMLKSDELTKADLSSLRIQLVGGSKVPVHLKKGLSQHLKNGNVCNGYGMSETAGVITVDNLPVLERDTVGRLNVGTHVKIIDDEGKRCGPNVDGEICVKMSYKCLGYYGNQRATDELFDNEGFMLTGDIGHFDEDGYLYIVDRKKEFLRYCGFQMSPSKIENYLMESSHIKSACVVGIHDDECGDLPAAVIVRSKGSNITENEVFDLVTDDFSDYYKFRGGVYFVDSLPTTPSGKVMRRKVKETVLSLLSV